MLSKSFFILHCRLVTQDLSNKITTVYFRLYGTVERGSELSCNVLTWVNVECLELWGQTAWKEFMCVWLSPKCDSQHFSVKYFSLCIYFLWWVISWDILIAIAYAYIPAKECDVCLACYTQFSSHSCSTLAPVLHSHFLESSHTHQNILVFTVTGQSSPWWSTFIAPDGGRVSLLTGWDNVPFVQGIYSWYSS